MSILTLATRSAGQKVNAAGQKPPQRNKKKYAISLFSGLLFNLSNPRDSEHSLFKTTITYWLTSAFLLSFSLRDWQLLLCSLKRGWEYFLKSLTQNNLCTKVQWKEAWCFCSSGIVMHYHCPECLCSQILRCNPGTQLGFKIGEMVLLVMCLEYSDSRSRKC